MPHIIDHEIKTGDQVKATKANHNKNALRATLTKMNHDQASNNNDSNMNDNSNCNNCRNHQKWLPWILVIVILAQYLLYSDERAIQWNSTLKMAIPKQKGLMQQSTTSTTKGNDDNNRNIISTTPVKGNETKATNFHEHPMRSGYETFPNQQFHSNARFFIFIRLEGTGHHAAQALASSRRHIKSRSS